MGHDHEAHSFDNRFPRYFRCLRALIHRARSSARRLILGGLGPAREGAPVRDDGGRQIRSHVCRRRREGRRRRGRDARAACQSSDGSKGKSCDGSSSGDGKPIRRNARPSMPLKQRRGLGERAAIIAGQRPMPSMRVALSVGGMALTCSFAKGPYQSHR
jgi:hypothetical protein